jgi:hypothetical protein
MPFDTAKSHMMLGSGFGAVTAGLRAHGPLWFYRGYLPACAGQVRHSTAA